MEKSYFKKNAFGLFNMKTLLLWSLFFFITLQAISQQSSIITGTITSSKNVPLVGVSIFVKGSTTGVYSDFDGKYKIKIPHVGKQLIVTYVGFKTQKIPIKSQSTINVILVEDIQKLDEVTINTGYQKISKERITGSVEKIDSKVLGIKTTQNIISKIEGEIPGLLVDKSGGIYGTGGEERFFTIRGKGSLQVGPKPLVVVDGFPITQDLSSINPNDVASVSILKDAAAASIWGIRAANGVIVITTKKGKRNHKPTIEYSSTFSITSQKNLHDLPWGSTASLLELQKEKVDNSWWVGGKNHKYAFGEGLRTYLNLKAGLITQSKADIIINRLKKIDSRDEFQKLFMNNVYWTQHNLAISGGGKYNTYRGSITYDKNENLGSFKGNELDKITSSFGGVFNLTPKLKFTNDFSFTTQSTKKNGFSNSNDHDNYLYQYDKILDDQGNYIDQASGYSKEFKKERLREVDRNPYSWNYNSKQEFDNKNNTIESTFFRIQTQLEYKLLSYLSVEGSYQYEWKSTNGTELSNENTYSTRKMVNSYTVLEDKKYVNYVPKGSILKKTEGVEKTHQGRFQLNFDKSFNKGIHKITALGGYEVRQQLNNSFSHTFYGYDPQTLTFGNVIYRQGWKVGGGPGGFQINPQSDDYLHEVENRFISYYGNFAYTYNHKYTLTGSIRLDDTNLFGASEKYRNIPLFSLGGKWDIWKEHFLENNSVIDYLSLRLTYGVSGNVDRSTSPQLILTPGNWALPSTYIDYLQISNAKNPDLRLERVFTTNIGIDFGLFNKFLDGSIEYYKKNSIDLLSNIPIHSVLGFNQILTNAGKMENEGIDIKLRAYILRKNALKYNTIVTFSYNRNRITKVFFANKTVDKYLKHGPFLKNHPFGYIYSYRSASLDSKGNPQILNKKGELIDMLNMQKKVNGVSKDANLTTEDLVYGGPTSPKYYGSWINNISYKSFYLRTLFTFKFGHVFRNKLQNNYQEYNNFSLGARYVHKDFDRRWKKPGDENKTNIPRFPTGNDFYSKMYFNNDWLYRDEFVDSAALIRLKEITIGYNLKSELLKKTGIDALNISFQIQNLGIINFNKWNVDPEHIRLPVKPTYTLHFSVNF